MAESNVGQGGVSVVPGSTQGVFPQWYGMYYATVSSNADPLGLGRCQLRIPQVLGTEVSPWAWALTTLSSTAASAATSTTPPAIGTVVAVMFLGGDLSNPAYLLITTSATTVTTSPATGGSTSTGSTGSTTGGATPAITTSSLPNATTSAAYSQAVSVSGGISPYTFAVTSGSLPSWATLNASTGVISGTPTANGTSTFTITVTDAAGLTTSGTITLTVGATGAVITTGIAVTTPVLPTGQVSQAYSGTLTAGGGTGSGYTWSVTSGSLPTGLSLAPSTGVVSGTPSAAGTSSVTVQVTDSGSNTATQVLPMTIITGPVGSPTGGPYQLAFADEFNVAYPTPYGTGPDPNTWTDHFEGGDMGRVNNTSEQEWYPHGYYNHSVSGSVLTLTAKNENPRNIDPTCPSPLQSGGQTGTFTAAMASSHLGFAFTYGYVEARIQNPSPASSWPAFWMLTKGDTWPPEIDINEWQPPGHTGQDQSGYYNMASTWQSNYESSDENWHVWGCRLDSSHVTWFLDGTQFAQANYDGNAFPWYAIFNYAIEAASGGSGYPAQYNIDYFRAWVPSGVPAQPVVTSISPSNGIESGGDITVNFTAVSGATSYRVEGLPDGLRSG